MHKLKVQELKKRCQTAGLPTTGTKKILIDRLEFYSAHNTLDNNLRTRLEELETTVARFRQQTSVGSVPDEPEPASSPPRTNAFVPQAVSSPCPEAVARDNHAHVTFANASAPIVSAVQTPLPRQQIVTTQGVGEVPLPRYVAPNSAPLYVPTGCVPQYVSAANTRQYHPISSTHQGYMHNGNGDTCYPGGVPQVTPSTFMAGYAGGVPPMVPISAPFGAHEYMNPAMVVQPNIGSQSGCYVNAPFVNVKDIVAILPDFDPTDESSLTATQFVQRVQMLKIAYQWRDDILIFAIQQKMKGHAKMWINSQCEIFRTWSQFVMKFTQAFPCQVNSADAHLKMATEQRKAHETPQAFYYRMMALGGKFGLEENAIARHIINGINDADLRKKISNDYSLCVDLLKDIEAYCCFNDVKTNNANTSVSHEAPMMKPKPMGNAQSNNKHIKCYNCSKYGHIAPRCPEPRKTERLEVVTNRVNKVDTGCEAKAEIIKKVSINGRSLEAVVDPGSARTLIRASVAEKLGRATSCNVALSGFGGGQYICSKQMTTVVLIDGHELQAECLLVDDMLLGHDVLVGRDLLCRQGKRVIIQDDDCWMEKAEQVAAKTTDVQPNEENKLTVDLNSKLKEQEQAEEQERLLKIQQALEAERRAKEEERRKQEEEDNKRLKSEIEARRKAEEIERLKQEEEDRKAALALQAQLEREAQDDAKYRQQLEPLAKRIKKEDTESETESATDTQSSVASGIDTDVKVETDGQMDKQKKKKHKKKTKSLKESKRGTELIAEAAYFELKILPKRNWKRLRNKYLNLQRQRVRELKRKAWRERQEQPQQQQTSEAVDDDYDTDDDSSIEDDSQAGVAELSKEKE